jgi:transcriptional regulator with XRE-family HTH domain
MTTQLHPVIEKLQIFLKVHKMTQIDFCEAIGYSQSYLNKMLKGVYPVCEKTEKAIEFCMAMLEKVEAKSGSSASIKAELEPLQEALLAKWSRLSDTQKCKVIIYIEEIIKSGGGDAIQSGELQQTEKMGFKSQLKFKVS